MATGKIVRTDDGSGPNIATITGTEDAVTKHWQGCVIVDNTDPINNKLAVDSSGMMQCDLAAASVSVAVTQGTATNLKAEVIGAGSAGTANTGVVTVQGIASMTPIQVGDNSSSLTVDGTVTAANTAGDVAHDSADSGNPVKVGGKAIAHAAPTSVTANDRTHWHFTRDGVGWVIGGSPAVQTVEYLWTTAQTNDSLVTVSAGTIVVVTRVSVFLDEATTVGVACRLGFGSSDALATLPTDGNTAAGAIFSHPGMLPGTSYTVGDGSGVLGYGADGENLVVTTEAATSGAGRISVSYYTIAS